MTSVIGFMTSTLFCTRCPDRWKCNGWIECPRFSPHDEANCSQQCPDRRLLLSYRRLLLSYQRLGRPTWGPIPCACNKPLGNMTCAGYGQVCYSEYGKLLVLFYFCKRHND